MKEEINFLNKNHTWSLVELPEGKRAIGCKWTYKIQKDGKEIYTITKHIW